MTETERWVNEVCGRIVQDGRVRLYRDLYKDLRAALPCGEACRLVAEGLRLTRQQPNRIWTEEHWCMATERAKAIAALQRLGRYAGRREVGSLAEVYDGQ